MADENDTTEGILPLVWRPYVTKVLVIDDCQEFRAWARFVLERDGLKVIEARDGLAGLQRAVEDTPNLIVVSEFLTGLDGVEITARLSEEVETSGLPILMSCELPNAALSRSAIKAGAQGLIPRSYRAADLSAPVRSALVETGMNWTAAESEGSRSASPRPAL
jgi:two-component system alkaline phosphatase synthesis response regulator PhoP